MRRRKGDLTPGEAATFQALMDQWQVDLNLGDWRIENVKQRADDALCDIDPSPADRTAWWRLGDWASEAPVTHRKLDEIACHETLHVLLADLAHMALNGHAEDAVLAAEHRIINTLTQLLVPKE